MNEQKIWLMASAVAQWLQRELIRLNVSELGDYVVAVAEDGDLDAAERRERLVGALSSATEDADAVNALVDELMQRLAACASEQGTAQAQAAAAAARRLDESRVLRGADSAPVEAHQETLEERRRRQALLARYDAEETLVMNEDGKVVTLVAPAQHAAAGGGGLEANDNAARVASEQAQQRAKAREAAAKAKEVGKDDGKKKKQEALEKRQQKAKKVERKGRG